MNTYHWLKRHSFYVNLVNAAGIAFWVVSFLHTGDGRLVVAASIHLLAAASLAWGLTED
jgi:hypothetical protein